MECFVNQLSPKFHSALALRQWRALKIVICGRKRSSSRTFSTASRNCEYMKSYHVLGVKTGSDQDTVRRAYLDLVKRCHPDSGSAEADASIFQEIDSAYRRLQEMFHNARWSANDCAGEYGLFYEEKKQNIEVEEYDIKHTAPQHRQYLSFSGYGSGSPSQRERQFQKLRAEVAVENVFQHRHSRLQGELSSNSLLNKDRKRAKNMKVRYGMDRLVEDLIQESMARGDFDNLSGRGKPLTKTHDHHNPYVDLVTHKINQVLIDNGFTPEWISLQKEIREVRERLQQKLYKMRLRLGPVPLSDTELDSWHNALESLCEDVAKLNANIGKYNLVVPLLQKQMMQYDLQREGERTLMEGEHSQAAAACPSSAMTVGSAKKPASVNLIVVLISTLLGH